MKHLLCVRASVIERPETIFALATAPGRAAIAVIRLSGILTVSIVRALTGVLPEPRVATLLKIRDPIQGDIIDQALVSWFPGPASFTGEDCVEFSIHGSRAVQSRLYKVLGNFESTRLAGPGEFTRRALENGKLSLLEVESLADLISAETEQQRQLGIQGLTGRFGGVVHRWRHQLLDAVVNVETSLDFADEEDAEAYDRQLVAAICRDLIASIDLWLKYADRGPVLRNGFTVLLSGPPNAGKSTLLNELARREVAIVSDLPGTTRDLIEVQLDLSGYLVNLIDSAGVRATADVVESIGINLAFKRAESADLILWLCDSKVNIAPPPEYANRTIWTIVTKCDIAENEIQANPLCNDMPVLHISAKTGYGLGELLDHILVMIDSTFGDDTDVVAINERQRSVLVKAREPLREISEGIVFPEVVATKLREAILGLEILIGKVGAEDIFDEIFSRFCIGK